MANVRGRSAIFVQHAVRIGRNSREPVRIAVGAVVFLRADEASN
jgi:hypothetical protein